jgi:hypothetical protein
MLDAVEVIRHHTKLSEPVIARYVSNRLRWGAGPPDALFDGGAMPR